MKNFRKTFEWIYVLGARGVLAAGAVAQLSACALNPNGDQQHVRIALPASTQSSSSMNLSSAFTLAGSSRSLMTAPQSMDSFNCFGINVTAADIAQDNSIAQGCTPSAGMLYPGLVQGLVSATDGFIDAVVPGGPARTFQLVGVQAPVAACPRIQDLINNSGSGVGDPYDLGRATADVFGDTSLTIKEAYNSANPQKAFCTGGGSGSTPTLSIVGMDKVGFGSCMHYQINARNWPAGVSSISSSVSAGSASILFYDSSCTVPSIGSTSASGSLTPANSGFDFYLKGSGSVSSNIPLTISPVDNWQVQNQNVMVTQEHFVMAPTGTTTTLGTCTQLTVTLRDEANPNNGNRNVYFDLQAYSSNSNTLDSNVRFFSDSGCSTSIGNGSASNITAVSAVTTTPPSATVYVKNTLATQSFNSIVVTDHSNIAAGMAAPWAFNLPASQITLMGNPSTEQAGYCNSYSIYAKDSSGNTANVVSATTVNLASSGSGGTFYSTAGCSSSTAVVSIPAGQSTALFYYLAPTLAPSSASINLTSASLGNYSYPISVIPAAASKIAFTTQPPSGGVMTGAVINPFPTVTVQDMYGNTVVSNSQTITVSPFTDASCATALSGTNGSVSGTMSLTAAGGVAPFNNLRFNRSATTTLYWKAIASPGGWSTCSTGTNYP